MLLCLNVTEQTALQLDPLLTTLWVTVSPLCFSSVAFLTLQMCDIVGFMSLEVRLNPESHGLFS